MAVVIQEECVCCAMCLAPCPENCITEEDSQFVVDQESCTECGECLPVCPVTCIITQ